MNDTIKDVLLITLVVSLIGFSFTLLIACLTSSKSTVGVCAYCGRSISEGADTVYCRSGEKYHADCYIKQIAREDDGK